MIKSDGTNLDLNEAVVPVNNWLRSLFSQINVNLSNTLMTPSTNRYPYRAYIETALSYGYNIKQTQLMSQLWIKDIAGHMEANDDTNEGLQDRKIYDADSRRTDGMTACRLVPARSFLNQRGHRFGSCEAKTRLC